VDRGLQLGTDDSTLLSAYVRNRDAEAFRRLTERHIDFVYAAALRQSGNAAAAQDITQGVFLLLSQRADSVKSPGALKGWLFNTTRYVASASRRSEQRRARREREAAAMRAEITLDKDSAQVTEYLDDALANLPEKDRQAVLLRFFDEQPMKNVGQAMGISERAAQKRVTRAIGRLRDFLTRRGATVTEITLPGVLAAHAAQKAPVFLSKVTIQVVLSSAQSTGMTGTAATLAKGATKMMVRNQVKIVVLKTLIATACVSAATAAVVKEEVRPAAPAPVAVAQADTGTDMSAAAAPAPATVTADDPKYQACRGAMQSIMDVYDQDDLQKLMSVYYVEPSAGTKFQTILALVSENDMAAYRVQKTAIKHFGPAGMCLFTRVGTVAALFLDTLARIGPEDMTVADNDNVILVPSEALPGMWPQAPIYFRQEGGVWKLDVHRTAKITYTAVRREPIPGETPEQTFAAAEKQLTGLYNTISDGMDQGKIRSLVDAQREMDQGFADTNATFSRYGTNLLPR
jgi:RNA polymerase sigma factor (sigma-70 family)